MRDYAKYIALGFGAGLIAHILRPGISTGSDLTVTITVLLLAILWDWESI